MKYARDLFDMELDPERQPAEQVPNHVPNIEVVNDDCKNFLSNLPDNKVDMVVTDPPYFLDGLDDCWRKGKEGAKKGTGAVGGLPIGMKFSPAQGKALQAFITEVSLQLARVLVPGGFMLFFSQPRLAPRMAVGLEDAGFEIRDVYAWHFTKKAQMKAFSQSHFVDNMNLPHEQKEQIKKTLDNRKTPQLRPQYESIIMAQNPKEGTFVNNWMTYRTGLIDTSKTLNGAVPSTVMTVEKPTGEERCHSHMTPKPVRLLSHLIEVFSLPGQLVLDPFLGSGSTAVAAIETGRACTGIEINPDYARLAQKRVDAAKSNRQESLSKGPSLPARVC